KAMSSNALDEILDAMRTYNRAHAAAPDALARDRISRAFGCAHEQRKQALARAFAARNGWELSKRVFAPEDIGTRRHDWRAAIAHALYFRGIGTRCNAAVVLQPYVTRVGGHYDVGGGVGASRHWNEFVAELQASYAARGLRVHTPPNARASFWFPGWTAFIVITKPDVVVHWLPEQLTFG